VKKDKDIIGELSPKELEQFKNILVCSAACKEVVEQTVRHYEKNKIAQEVFWDNAAVKYKLDLSKFKYSINAANGEISKGDEIHENEELNKFVDKLEFRHFLKKEIEKAFK
jgi:hypothetical protein